MLESLKEVKTSVHLQKEIDVQKRELKKIQAQIEAQKLAESDKDKANAAAKAFLNKPVGKDSLKSKFEAVGAGLPESPNIKISHLI